jgi:hypothetical protein
VGDVSQSIAFAVFGLASETPFPRIVRLRLFICSSAAPGALPCRRTGAGIGRREWEDDRQTKTGPLLTDRNFDESIDRKPPIASVANLSRLRREWSRLRSEGNYAI